MASILDLTLTTVRNLSDQLQQHRNRKSDVISERAYISPTACTGHGPCRAPTICYRGRPNSVFKRTALPVEKDV